MLLLKPTWRFYSMKLSCPSLDTKRHTLHSCLPLHVPCALRASVLGVPSLENTLPQMFTGISPSNLNVPPPMLVCTSLQDGSLQVVYCPTGNCLHHQFPWISQSTVGVFVASPVRSKLHKARSCSNLFLNRTCDMQPSHGRIVMVVNNGWKDSRKDGSVGGWMDGLNLPLL